MSSDYKNAYFEPDKGRCDQTNKYGINTTALKKRLLSVIKDLKDFKPKELARVLVKIANDIDSEATILQANQLEINRSPEWKDV